LDDTFEVESVDGTTHTVTVTITGVNDAAVIAGDDEGAATDDPAAVRTASATLTITDVDTGEDSFVADTIVGGVGELVIDTLGNWTYEADNTLPGVQALGAGDTFNDTFAVESVDGTTHTVTVTITGVNDAAVIGGDDEGAATEDAAAMLTDSGTLTIADADSGESLFLPNTFVGTLGSLDIDTAGNWTYEADNAQSAIQSLGQGDTAEDAFDVMSADGTTHTVTVTVTGVNDAAVIIGDDEGEVTEDDAPTLTDSGQLVISDVDSGEGQFVAGTVSGAFGSLDIDADGTWTYTADNAQPGIQDLDTGESAVDTIVVEALDGTTHAVTITIHGATELNQPPTDVHLTMTHTPGGSSLPSGAVSALTLGTLSTVDGDPGDTHTYTLEAGSAAGFAISGASLQTSIALAAGSTYTLNVKSTDSGAPSASITETITIITGTAGADTTLGTTAGDDVVYGMGSADSINGGMGDDAIFGQNGGDQLFGGDGNDMLDGGGSADGLRGEAGNDILIGGAGNDQLYGGAGDDTIDAGGTLDQDTVYFGAVLNAADVMSNGSDTILNFDADAAGGQDRINLDALFDSLGVANGSRAARVSISGSDLSVDMDGNGSFEYLIANVTVAAGVLDGADLVLF